MYVERVSIFNNEPKIDTLEAKNNPAIAENKFNPIFSKKRITKIL